MKEDFETRVKEQKMRWEARCEYKSGKSHIWTGVFILLIGVAALVRVTNPELPGWWFSWKTFLVALGLFIGLKHRFKGGAWFILMLVGGAFLAAELYPHISIRRYIWPALLIIVGAYLIFRPRRRWYGSDSKTEQGSSETFFNAEETYTGEDFVDSTSIFGGAKKNIISKNFKGGDIVNIFGGTELDLTQADMSRPAELEITTIFGGTKLVIPSNWEIKSEAVMIFGGIEDKRKMQTVTGNPEKTLILKGTVVFGGIDIKSF